jgi:CheY-like chemotaxis protein
MTEDKKTVVCIEDEPDMIDFIKFILERRGFTLIGAVGGREGLNTVRQVKPDVVLLDLMMPEMDGWEVHRRLNADDDLKNIPVIAITALAPGTHMAQGLQVDDYVTKPFLPQELVQSVNKVLGLVA